MDGFGQRLEAPRPSGLRRVGAVVACLALIGALAELHGPGVDHGWPGASADPESGAERPAADGRLGAPETVERSPCHACLHRLQAQASLPRAAGAAGKLPRTAVALHASPLLPSRLAEEPWSSRGPPV